MSNRWRPFKLKFSAILLPSFLTNLILPNIYVSALKTLTFLHILMNYCYFVLTKPQGHLLILFELTPESLKSEKGAKIKPTPYVQWSSFDDFSALYEKDLSTVFTWSGIYCQNSSIMSQQHSFENKSWPLDDLEIWPFHSIEVCIKTGKNASKF